jgi:hypothetical protein
MRQRGIVADFPGRPTNRDYQVIKALLIRVHGCILDEIILLQKSH